MEKIDARKLGPEGRETLRKMVLRLKKQSDMSSVELAKIAGVHVRTVQAWLRKARTDGAGALIEKTRGRPYGACRKLTMAQEVWVRQRIVGAVPEQLSLPFALWTRRAIQPEFDSSKAHFRPTPSNGAGFRATGRQKPRYTGC